MKKIKDIIIHWLGGYTATERSEKIQDAFDKGYKEGFDVGSLTAQKSFDKEYLHGKKEIYDSLMKKAGELYGIPADDWCKEMYSFITSIRTKL